MRELILHGFTPLCFMEPDKGTAAGTSQENESESRTHNVIKAFRRNDEILGIIMKPSSDAENVYEFISYGKDSFGKPFGPLVHTASYPSDMEADDDILLSEGGFPGKEGIVEITAKDFAEAEKGYLHAIDELDRMYSGERPEGEPRNEREKALFALADLGRNLPPAEVAELDSYAAYVRNEFTQLTEAFYDFYARHNENAVFPLRPLTTPDAFSRIAAAEERAAAAESILRGITSGKEAVESIDTADASKEQKGIAPYKSTGPDSILSLPDPDTVTFFSKNDYKATMKILNKEIRELKKAGKWKDEDGKGRLGHWIGVNARSFRYLTQTASIIFTSQKGIGFAKKYAYFRQVQVARRHEKQVRMQTRKQLAILRRQKRQEYREVMRKRDEIRFMKTAKDNPDAPYQGYSVRCTGGNSRWMTADERLVERIIARTFPENFRKTSYRQTSSIDRFELPSFSDRGMSKDLKKKADEFREEISRYSADGKLTNSGYLKLRATLMETVMKTRKAVDSELGIKFEKAPEMVHRSEDREPEREKSKHRRA